MLLPPIYRLGNEDITKIKHFFQGHTIVKLWNEILKQDNLVFKTTLLFF